MSGSSQSQFVSRGVDETARCWRLISRCRSLFVSWQARVLKVLGCSLIRTVSEWQKRYVLTLRRRHDGPFWHGTEPHFTWFAEPGLGFMNIIMLKHCSHWEPDSF